MNINFDKSEFLIEIEDFYLNETNGWALNPEVNIELVLRDANISLALPLELHPN